jgi:hypothetical protein
VKGENRAGGCVGGSISKEHLSAKEEQVVGCLLQHGAGPATHGRIVGREDRLYRPVRAQQLSQYEGGETVQQMLPGNRTKSPGIEGSADEDQTPYGALSRNGRGDDGAERGAADHVVRRHRQGFGRSQGVVGKILLFAGDQVARGLQRQPVIAQIFENPLVRPQGGE